MNDLIDRQALYEAFASIDWWGRNRHEVLTHGAHDQSDAFITYKDAVKAIDDAPTIEQKKGEWISVNAQPPEFPCIVIWGEHPPAFPKALYGH